jgi:hypothetical protein
MFVIVPMVKFILVGADRVSAQLGRFTRIAPTSLAQGLPFAREPDV